MNSIKRIAITLGEPAGIGPDLFLSLAQQDWPHALVVFANKGLLEQRAKQLGLSVTLMDYDKNSPATAHVAGTLVIENFSLNAEVVAGQLNENNSLYVLNTLHRATEGCLTGEFDAVVTGPVHKGIINKAGIPFSGHTEFLAEQSNSKQVVMMLATEGLKVALATTHLPLSEVPKHITRERLTQVIRILHQDLLSKFSLSAPKIYVCGLNPHAGEDGHLGREEIEIISPTLDQLRTEENINLIGPLPADTLFQDKYLQDADAVLAMYHDQGLPVLKFKGFGRSINITLGLPFIRTSVDHGTALELAGTGKANAGSFLYALTHAINLVEKK